MKKIIIVILLVLLVGTGCENKVDYDYIKYDDKDIIYICNEEDLEKFDKNVIVNVKESQVYVTIDNDNNIKEYSTGEHKFDNNANINKCLFYSKEEIENNKFGTPTTIKVMDPNYGRLEFSMYGNYSYRINDISKFLDYYDGKNMPDELYRQYIISFYQSHVSRMSYYDIIKETKMASSDLKQLNKDLEKYGIEITEVIYENIKFTTDSLKVIAES